MLTLTLCKTPICPCHQCPRMNSGECQPHPCDPKTTGRDFQHVQSHVWFGEDSWAPAQCWSFACPLVAGETEQPWSPYGPASVAALRSPLVCHLSDAGKGFVVSFLCNCPSALTATDSWGTCREPYNRNISPHWHRSVWEVIDKITFKRVALLTIEEHTNLKENKRGVYGRNQSVHREGGNDTIML